MKKRIFVFLIAVLMLAAFAGCNMISVNEERDGNRVVAEVNGEKIYKSTILKQAKLYLTQYGFSQSDDNYSENLNSMLEQFLEEEILYVILKQKCEELGVPQMTAEQKEELDSALEVYESNMRSTAENKYPEEDYPDEKERQALVDEYAEQRLEQYGFYNGAYERSYYASFIVENMTAHLAGEYSPEENEIKAFYDQQLKDQKDVIDNNNTMFEDFENEGLLLFVPENVRYVRNLLISLPEEVQDELATLRGEELEEEADALRDEELAKIKDRADEAYEAALEDFEAALLEYGEDPGMEEDSYGFESGYRIFENNATYDSIFVETGLALEEVGDVSKPTASDFGYYIIEYFSEMEPGEVPFEEARDMVEEYMISKNEEESYTVAVGNWLEEAEVTRYENRIAANY